MVRSILLRGFDQSIADKIKEYMISQGTKFINECVPTSIEETSDGKKKVFYSTSNKKIEFDVFDTVMLAVGRSPDVKNIGIEKVGICLDKNTGKLIVNEAECTNVSNIFCIGDCAFGKPELTPSAIMAGRLLARRLFAGSKVKTLFYLELINANFRF